ncbi:hypothetical protein DV738_g4226, partial [Chaetothyriales sp. CBS 135597]
MSQQYRTSQHQHSRVKKKEEDPDAFMRLSDREIAGCITDIGVSFQPSDLQKPNPQLIQMVFEHLGDLLMNATRDSIEPAMRAAAEDVCPDFPEIVPLDTRLLMGFFVTLRQMLVECGVHDFSFNDLVKPTYDRLVKIFSYVINFVRFRESQTNVIDENLDKAETTKNRIETLYAENQDMEARLDDMKRNRKAMEVALKEKTKRNDELKVRLLELRKEQERVAEQLERTKADKSRVQATMEEKAEKLVRVRQEGDKLRPYAQQSPEDLKNALTELSDSLMKERQQIDRLERRSRALQTSAESFSIVHSDVQSCVKVLEDISVELQKEEEEDAKATRNRDVLAERSANCREVEQSEMMLKKQLDKWSERTEELRRKHKERDEANKTKMEELRSLQKHLREERADKGREMERRRARIEQIEKKMADLKENIENEVHTAHEEYLKLDAHIRLYLTEMEQCI